MKTEAKTAAEPKRRAPRNHLSAREKCQAILSIWAERRKPSEVCKELGIQWGQLNQWQDQAMEGMLKALEPRTREEEEKGPILGPRLQQLLERKAISRSGKMIRFQERLARLQQGRPPVSAAKPAEAKEPMAKTSS